MSSRKVYWPWGRYDSLEIRPRIQIKRSTVLPGAHLTLQKHRHRAEHRVVVSGEAQVICADEEFTFQPMESTFIPAGTMHRLEILGVTCWRLSKCRPEAILAKAISTDHNLNLAT